MKLLVDNKGISELRPAEVSAGQSLSELNETLFAPIAGLKIKWIYMGRTLQAEIPTTVVPDATIHVMIQQAQSSSDPFTPATPTQLSQIDKLVLGTIYGLFSIFLALVWNRYRTHPGEFAALSIFLMIAFSAILLLSVVSQFQTSRR